MSSFLDRVLKVWKKQLPLTPAQLQAFGEDAYLRGWGLAGIWETKFLERIQESITKAQAAGSTCSEWTQNEAQKILDGFGAGVSTYKGGKRWDPWYSELVMRNATQASFAGGRYSAMFAPEWQRIAPFVRYYATLDERTRPTHRALHGRVFRKDDDAARNYYPPLGHNCRCGLTELTLAEVEDAGYQITDGSRIPYLPIEGGGTVGRPPGGWDIDRVTANASRVLKQATTTTAPTPPPALPTPAPVPKPAKGWEPEVKRIENLIRKKSIEHAAIVDQSGKVLLPLKRGTASEVEFLPHEVAFMKNAILTHNHPNGASFSKWRGDMSLAWVSDMAEMRAVSEVGGKKVIYRLIRPEKGWMSAVKTPEEFKAATTAAEVAVEKSGWFAAQKGLLKSGKIGKSQFLREYSHRVSGELARALGAGYERR